MYKILYSIALLSSIITQAHSSLYDLPYSTKTSIPWYGTTDKKDLAIATSMSAAFFGGSFLVKDKNTRTIMQSVALLVPLVRFLSTTGIIKNLANNIPVLKSVIGCNNLECEGVCDECVMRHCLIDAGIAATFLSLSASIGDLVKDKKKNQEVVSLEEECVVSLDEECPVCRRTKQEIKDEGNDGCHLMPCCENKKWICGECINKLFALSHNDDTIKCPLCRTEVNPYSQTINNFKAVKQELANKDPKVESILQNRYLSPLFNAMFLRGGTVIGSCAALFAYSDHRPIVKDGAITVACCGGLIALASKITDPVKQRQLLISALIIPFIGLLNKSEKIRKIGNEIPFLNHFFGCKKEGCHTICAHCKLRNAHRATIAFIGTLLIGVSAFGRS